MKQWKRHRGGDLSQFKGKYLDGKGKGQEKKRSRSRCVQLRRREKKCEGGLPGGASPLSGKGGRRKATGGKSRLKETGHIRQGGMVWRTVWQPQGEVTMGRDLLVKG